MNDYELEVEEWTDILLRAASIGAETGDYHRLGHKVSKLVGTPCDPYYRDLAASVMVELAARAVHVPQLEPARTEPAGPATYDRSDQVSHDGTPVVSVLVGDLDRDAYRRLVGQASERQR